MTVGTYCTLAVAHHHIFVAHTKTANQTSAGNGSRTGSVDCHPNVFHPFVLHNKSVDKCRTHTDSRTVLVVVHHRDAATVDKAVFDFKTLGSLYVLKIDASETRCQRTHYLHHAPRVFFIDFYIYSINPRKNLEQIGRAHV